MKRISGFTLYIFMLICSPLFSQNEKIEQYGMYFIKALNSSDSTAQVEIINKIFSSKAIAEIGTERLLNFMKRMHSTYAQMEYHHSEVISTISGAGKIMHVYAKKNGAVMWSDFQIRLDEEPPFKIYNIVFIAEVSEPVSLPNGSIDQKYTLDWLQNYLEKLRTQFDLYGSILISKNNKTIFEEYYGFEDVAKKNPITNKTLFNVASGGKMFTALSIAGLVEAGKLKYDDKITNFLTGFGNQTKADKITIHHLLSHTSGVAEYWTNENNKAVYSAENINDYLKLVYKSGFDFDAGEKYQYCNSNYILLGAIIEKVSGQTFYDFVGDNIFKPAGMTSSGYFIYGSKNTATSLARGKEENTWIEAVHGIKGSSAGGAYSNTTDILKFSDALKKNKIVSEETLQNMIIAKNNKIKEPGEFDYGYGFEIEKSAQEISFGHGGIAGGVNFEFKYFPRLDITLILFGNQNNGAYDDLKKNVTKLITGARKL